MNHVLFETAMNWWRGLQARERLVLGVGGIGAAVLLLYGLVWSPLQNELTRLRAAVSQEQAQLEWMRAQSARVTQLRGLQPKSINSAGLLSFVDQSAISYDVKSAIKRIEPEGANAVRVALDGVTFDPLINWIVNLQKQGGVRVENATLDGLSAPGTVNARLLLRAGS